MSIGQSSSGYTVRYNGGSCGPYVNLDTAITVAKGCGRGAEVIHPKGHSCGVINERGRLSTAA